MITEDYDLDDNLSDISLDEDDEELVWRVFFSQIERIRNIQAGIIDDEEDDVDEADVDEADDDDDDDDDHGAGDTINERLHTELRHSKKKGQNDDADDDYDFDDLSDLSDISDVQLLQRYKDLKEEKYDKVLTDEDKKKLLIANFTSDQMERFEAYRRMTVNKPGVKKVVNGIVGHSIPQALAILVAGISKSFIGEIITKALSIQERDNKGKLILEIQARKNQKKEIIKSLASGQEIEVDDKNLHYEGDRHKPLQPNQIREAWRLYQLENSSAFDKNRKDADSSTKRSKHYLA